MKIFILVLCMLSNVCNGCNLKTDSTPIKYRNTTSVQNEVYSNHRQFLIDHIRSLIEKKEEPYYSKENDSLTQVYIDTILYGPLKNKLAFFVITQNSDDKLLSEGNSDEFHYDAHCFIGNILDNKILNISWLSAYNLSRYESLDRASSRIRQMYFTELREKQDPRIKYNLDDVRFWESQIWNN